MSLDVDANESSENDAKIFSRIESVVEDLNFQNQLRNINIHSLYTVSISDMNDTYKLIILCYMKCNSQIKASLHTKVQVIESM